MLLPFTTAFAMGTLATLALKLGLGLKVKGHLMNQAGLVGRVQQGVGNVTVEGFVLLDALRRGQN